jgi:hypothetical protein
MPGYSSFIGLNPTTEIVTPFSSSVQTDMVLPNVSALDDEGDYGSTYLYRSFYQEFPGIDDNCVALTLAEIPSREYNYVRVLACTYRKNFNDGSESDFLIDFRATWNTPLLSGADPGAISQESKILANFGDLTQGVCQVPGTNLYGIYAQLGAGGDNSDTILIKGLGIRNIVMRGIYEVI